MIKIIGDLRRIVSVTEGLLFLAGRSLQRRAMRNGFLLAIAFGSTYLGVQVADSQILTQEQILTLVIIAFASYPVGTLLVHISNWLTRGNLTAAAAGYLHLTSHYKQARMREHMDRVWEEVFKHEAAVKRELRDVIHARARLQSMESRLRRFLGDIPEDVRSDLRIDTNADVNALMERLLTGFAHDPDQIEAIHELFVLSAMYALTTPIPLKLQSRQVGFDLAPLEDWYEKGLFAYEDYPCKAYGRDPLIKQIEKQVTPRWKYILLRVLTPEPMPSFWFSFTARKFGVLIGKGLRELNKPLINTRNQDYFDAQHFLWPSHDLDQAVLRDLNHRGEALLERLKQQRSLFIGQLFTHNEAVARQHVLRLFQRDLEVLFKLRLKYDFEFAAGRLSQTPELELAEIHTSFGELSSVKKLVSSAKDKADIAAVETERFISLSSYENLTDEQSRALHVFFFTSNSKAELRTQLAEYTVERAEKNSMLLVRLRTYYCLTKIQLNTYWQVVASLAELTKK